MKVTKYKSSALESVHVTAKGLFSIGMIDNAKMLEYDRTCLVGAAQEKSKNGKKPRQVSDMTTEFTYRSDADEAIHTSAQALFSIGVFDKDTMREFDEACLVLSGQRETVGDSEHSEA